MVDQYGRTIEYLRISVTDRCNLRCSYCMPREGICARTHQEMLRYEEIVRVVGIFQKLGIRKIKITGGEPLVKKNLEELVSSLSGIQGIEELTLTTNGVYLAHQAKALREAGITAVNISLDTLNRDQYQQLTGEDALPQVWEGIQRALQSGFQKVKINAVILQGINEDAIIPLAALAKTSPLAVRFIEIMPVGMGVSYRGLGQQAIQDRLEQAYGKLEAYGQDRWTESGASPGNEPSLGNGPAVYYRLPGFRGEIGFISALSHAFCAQCNRLRLTADGQLKTCLDAPPVLDVRALLRGGRTDAEIMEAVRKAIYEKPARHHFTDGKDADREKRVMTQIGG